MKCCEKYLMLASDKNFELSQRQQCERGTNWELKHLQVPVCVRNYATASFQLRLQTSPPTEFSKTVL